MKSKYRLLWAILMLMMFLGCNEDEDTTTSPSSSVQKDSVLYLSPSYDSAATSSEGDVRLYDEKGDLVGTWSVDFSYGFAQHIVPGCYEAEVEQNVHYADNGATFIKKYIGAKAFCVSESEARVLDFDMLEKVEGADQDPMLQNTPKAVIQAECQDLNNQGAECIIKLYDDQDQYLIGWLWEQGYRLSWEIKPGCYQAQAEQNYYRMDEPKPSVDNYRTERKTFCVENDSELPLDLHYVTGFETEPSN